LNDNTKICLKKIISSLEDKKGIDISVLDMEDLVSYTDFVVLCTGNSDTHVNALVDGIRKNLTKKLNPTYINFSKDNSWWILDFVDIVLHVFNQDARAYYDLDSLWDDAKRVNSAEL
jgi:ribosome-associated protein